MKMNRISIWALFAVAIAAAMLWFNHDKTKVDSPASAVSVLPPATTKIVTPARIIPADVNQNMQAALAAREKKLQQLAKGK